MRIILCKNFLNLGGSLLFVFLSAMVLMPFQSIHAQAEEQEKGSVALKNTIVQAQQKTIPDIAHGNLERGWLGVGVQNLTPELARSFGVESTRGALITDVVKNGPADKAGMQKGDVVIVYQGKEIYDSIAFRNEVAKSPIGQEVKVTVLRRGEKLLLTVKIGNLQDSIMMLATSLSDRFGANARLVSAKEAEKYNLDSQRGVVVVWLDPIGPLAEVGFEVGDIILEINGQAIESEESFLDLVSSLKPHQRITFIVLDHRSGRTGYVQIKAR